MKNKYPFWISFVPAKSEKIAQNCTFSANQKKKIAIKSPENGKSKFGFTFRECI